MAGRYRFGNYFLTLGLENAGKWFWSPMNFILFVSGKLEKVLLKLTTSENLKVQYSFDKKYYLGENICLMKTIEIKQKLINEIKLSKNKNLLEEFYRFINLDNEIEEPYKLNAEQKSAVAEAREQIKNGDYLTNEQGNQEIDEWLNK